MNEKKAKKETKQIVEIHIYVHQSAPAAVPNYPAYPQWTVTCSTAHGPDNPWENLKKNREDLI